MESPISNVITANPLLKNYITYCQKLDFEASPNIPMKTLIIKIQTKTYEMDLNKRKGGNQFLLIGG